VAAAAAAPLLARETSRTPWDDAGREIGAVQTAAAEARRARARVRSAVSGVMLNSRAEGSSQRQRQRFGVYRHHRQALIMDKLLYDKLDERDRAGCRALLRATRPGFCTICSAWSTATCSTGSKETF